ncbi:unnamed protein product [Caenorhabditis angaria]|uniref:Uncharacterized protein n=1 Tax=Caenorhabditis angaria TaxID=860376 RepID=A0A9P1MVV5_9PELO|nr:unnamed protein product [Caenorhabditis angaria]
MYEEGFGNLFHISCSGLTCRDIPRDLEYGNRKLVHHNNQGRRIRKHRDGRLFLLKDVGIDGKQIKKPRIGSPSGNRKQLKNKLENAETRDVIHEESLPEFPGWYGQLEGLQKKLGESWKFSENVVIQEEIKKLWKTWTKESAKIYLQNDIHIPRYIGRAPWKDQLTRNTQKISDQLQLNTKIISMFFEKFRDRCLVDCSFLLSENGRSVGELEKQLADFVHQTKRILNFEWPMEVANLMLDEGDKWIPLLVNSTSHTVFNAVAATMARLLYDLIFENINRVKDYFNLDDRARLIIVLNEGEEVFDYWQKINVLLELSKVPRVDHKIYPRMFTEAWIDVRSWFDAHSIIFKPLPQPFGSMNLRIFEIEKMLEKYEEKPENIEFWNEISKEILNVRDQILRQRSKTQRDFIIFDSAGIKQRSLVRITELEERAKKIILDDLGHKNNDYMEYFVMPDYDIRQYYEISRLGRKLEQLVNFVWDRIHHERQWITKQVSEQTSKNYYECEMIEKEWLDCLKKYRSAIRVNEVQKVQSKMANLAERSVILTERDEKLIGQRSLLGLPSSPIDCVRISKMCEFFARLTSLHYQTLLHHESCLRMRISDVNHADLVAETERLQDEKDIMVDEVTLMNEHVTTSNEALSKIQNVLNEFEKLLPVLGAISCQAMKDRHWQQILQDSENPVKVEGNPLVSELLEMNFIEKADKFEQVGAQAEKERVLEKSIEVMREQWKSAKFVTHQQGKAGSSGELLTTELNVQMQAHLARSQTILSSPFAFSILDQIRHWLDTLLNLNTFVVLYKNCDSRWKKIEGVFSTEDIAYQMPHEFRTFKKISLRWLHINNQITEERPILEQMELVIKLNTELAELEVLFGKMETGFHAYLRKKRAVFPRLFCLSDELVLSLICDSREPSNCKSYIPLLFPALTTFDQNTKMEIVSVSTRSDVIQLAKPVNVNLSKRHVEKWMHELDVQIRSTVKIRIRQLIEKLNFKIGPVETLLSEPTQVAVIYLRIAITQQIELAMKQNTMTIFSSDLKLYIRECQHCIIQKLSRRKFLPMIYHTYKHANNLVTKFISEQVVFIDDHRWTNQLRYYWHMENVFIRIGTVSVRYDYEIQDFANFLDYKLIDESLRYMIFMNHFGWNCKPRQINELLARCLAGALGRPFVICDYHKNSAEFKMIIDGALLFGGLVFVKNYGGKSVERDIYTAHNLNNLKYHFETEITINSSFMLFLEEKSFGTCRNVDFENPNHLRIVEQIFSLNSISHRDKLTQKFQIISEFQNFFYPNLWKNHINSTIFEILEKNEELLEGDLEIGEIILENYTVGMKNEHRKKFSDLLMLSKKVVKDKSKYHFAERLCKMLENHQVVVVLGESMTGKSKIIEEAAKIRNSELHIEFGLWQDLQNYGESLKNTRRLNKWIVLDGFIDVQTISWIYRLLNENTLFPWSELPFLAPNEKLIIETNVEIFNGKLPVIRIEHDLEKTESEFSEKLSEYEKQRIHDVFEIYEEANHLKPEVTRIVQIIENSLTNCDEKIFENLLKTTMLSFIPLQQLDPILLKKEDFVKNVPFFEGWYNFSSTSDGFTAEEFYISRIIALILNTDLIPLLISTQNCCEFSGFLTKLLGDLDGLGWHVITLSLDDQTTVEDIKTFVQNCSIMFGGRDEMENRNEGSNFLMIHGIEMCQPNVVDWIRYSYDRKLITKILFVSTKSRDFFAPRIRRYIFAIDFLQITELSEPTKYPYANYKNMLQIMTKDIKIKDIRDSITNQLVDALCDAQILNFYEKIMSMKIAGEYRIVRGKGFMEIGELVILYQNAIIEREKRDKKYRKHPIIIHQFLARNINFIEKVTSASFGHMLIVSENLKNIETALRISTELNKQMIYFTDGIDGIQEWRDLFKDKIIRECLLDGKETVVSISITHKEILADVNSICCHKMIPPRYLTRLLLSEFGEKHTLEGKGIWEMLESKLSVLKFCVILKPSDFSWFLETYPKLASRLILNIWGNQTKNEIDMEMIEDLGKSEIFSKIQINQIILAIDKLVELKLIKNIQEKQKLLNTIIRIAINKKLEVEKTMSKYEKGMDKMKKAEEQVAGMQGELLRLQPQLLRTSIETSMLMSTIEKETIEVENAREVVAANENKANEAATKAQSLKAESEAELASAIPALEAAVEALETMTQSDVSSLKTMRFPPYAVRLCMEAVCIILGVKPTKVANDRGEVVNDYWISGQKLLSDIHFLNKIRTFPRDETSRRTMKLIRDKYLSKEEFDPEKVRQCSLAAEGLCRWVLAIDMYNQISKIVEPKRERLRKSEMLVKQHLKQLEVKRKALLKVTEKLQGLSDQFSQMCQKKQELESQISSCEIKMERAERLVQALGGEKDKWQTKITDIQHEDSLCVPYSIGTSLVLHIFAKLPIDEREIEIRKTMRILFPKLEIRISCDLRSLVKLVDDPILFINDDGRAIEVLKSIYPKVIESNKFSEKERTEALTQDSVIILDNSQNITKEIENSEVYLQKDQEVILKIYEKEHEVNKGFRIFIRSHVECNGNMIVLNNKFSDAEIRFEICEKMGSVNWDETLNHYNEMVQKKDMDIGLLDKTENEMLDLLGRSKDLDDERAIDLLAEARNLQAAVAAREKDIAEIEGSLRSIEFQMSPAIEWSIKIVKMLYSLCKLDSFYRTSLKSLVNVLGTKLFENLATVNLDEVIKKISTLFWKFCQHFLAWDDKLIVYHLLHQNMNFRSEQMINSCSGDSDCPLQFTQFILKSTCRSIIFLKYDSETYASILQAANFGKTSLWRVYSILDHVILKIEKLTDEPSWLFLNLNDMNENTLEKLKEIKEKIETLHAVHPSFRCIVGLSTDIFEIDEQEAVLMLSSKRFYYSAAANLSQMLTRFNNNTNLRVQFDKSEESQRHQVIRLICLHFALRTRSQVDTGFKVQVDDADLLAMLKLYQELRNLSDQPNEALDIPKVRTNIIEPIYFAKSRLTVEFGIVQAMTNWIFEQNLSISADTLLKKLLREESSNFEDFAHFIQTHDDILFCGFNARICRDLQQIRQKKLSHRMRSLFEDDFNITSSSLLGNPIEKSTKFRPRSWLRDVESEGENVIDAREISNLTELVTFLKMKFALRYKIQIVETSITAEFISVSESLERCSAKEMAEHPTIRLSHCILCSAQMSKNELKEPHSRQDQFVAIQLRAVRRSGSANPRSIPLICPMSQKPVANLPIQSQFPIGHWHLRGTHVTVGRSNLEIFDFVFDLSSMRALNKTLLENSELSETTPISMMITK